MKYINKLKKEKSLKSKVLELDFNKKIMTLKYCQLNKLQYLHLEIE